MNPNLRTGLIAAIFIALGFGVWYLFRGPNTPDVPPTSSVSVTAAALSDQAAIIPETSPLPTPPAPDLVANGSGGDGPREASRFPQQKGNGAVSGVVIGLDNAPVPNATLALERYDVDKPPQLPSVADSRAAQTSATGRFSFDQLPIGQWEYFLTASTGGAVGAQFVELTPDHPRAEVTLRLEPAGALSGHVVDADNKPVDKALLMPFEQEGLGRSRASNALRRAVRAESGPDGAFTFAALPKGRWKIMVRAEGYATFISDFVATGATDARFVLKAGVAVSGKVVNANTREPKAGVTVELSPTDEPTDLQKVASGEGGAFRFPALRSAIYTATIEDPLWVVSGDAPKVAITDGHPVSGLEVRVTAGSVITGRVVDAATKRGVSGVKLVAFAQRDGFAQRHSEPTDADGAYRLTGLADAQYIVQCEDAPGYSRSRNGISVRVPLGKQIDHVDIPLEGGVSIRGRVVDAKKQPVANAQVSGAPEDEWEATSAATDAHGQFELKGFPLAAKVSIWAEYQDAVSKPAGPLTLTGHGLDNVELILDQERNGSISGVVVDTKDKPVPYLRLSAYDTIDNHNVQNDANTDSQGKFTILRLKPGVYSLRMSSPAASGATVTSPENVEVAQGAQVTGVRLVYTADGSLSIAGTVTDSNGAGVPSVRVDAQGPAYSVSATTDASGAYTLAGLNEGAYSVSVQQTNYSYQHRTANAGDTKVDFQLEQCGGVEGQALDARTGAPLPAFEIQALHGNITTFDSDRSRSFVRVYDADGRFNLPGLDSGETTLAVRAEGYGLLLQPVGQVEPGQIVGNIRLRLQAAATVQGRVVGPNRKPVSGAVIFLGENHTGSSVAQSAADGTFTINNASGASITLTASHPQYAPATVTANLAASGPTRVEIALVQGGTVSGRITSGSNTAARKWVSLQIAGREVDSAEISQDGPYEFRNVPAGEAVVLAGLVVNQLTSRQLQRTVTVTAGQVATVDIDFSSGSGAKALTGVVTVQGKPAVTGDIQANLAGSDSEDYAFAHIQPDGSYRFDALPPGTVQLLGKANAADGRQGRINVQVTVPRTGAARQNIVAIALAQIRGTVVGATGGYTGVIALRGETTLPDAITSELFEEYQKYTETTSKIAADGSFTLNGLAPGAYTIVAFSAPDQSPESLSKTRHAASTINIAEGVDATLNLKLR